jgi:hypothetical protein
MILSSEQMKELRKKERRFRRPGKKCMREAREMRELGAMKRFLGPTVRKTKEEFEKEQEKLRKEKSNDS